MNKKPLTMLAAFVLLAALLAGCASGASGDRLEAVKKAGKLVLGTESGYQPFEFQIVKGGKAEIVGLDIDIAREIASDIGVELVISDMNFDGIPTAVQQGVVDIAIAGMNPKEDRKEAMDFSDSYFKATHSVVVRKGEGEGLASIEAFGGKTVGAQKGSTLEDLANGAFTDAGAKTLVLPQISALLLELKTGNIDGVLMETPVAQSHVRGDSSLEIAPFIMDDPDIGSCIVGVQKNNPELLAAVNATLKRLRDTGKIDEYYLAALELAAENAVE